MNIMLNDYCNLTCKYCFAEETMGRACNEDLSLENLGMIISFFKENNIRNVRLIGGEPTLHPHFNYFIIKMMNDPFFESLHIFSNMTFNQETLETITLVSKLKPLTMMPNCNEEREMGSEKYQLMMNNVVELSKHNIIKSIGVNLYKPDMDLDYIFDLASKAGAKEIRWAVTVPNHPIDETFDVKKYFLQFKPLLKTFFRRGVTEKIKLHQDCNTIPMCIFSDKEFRDMTYLNPEILSHPPCHAALDIKPNLDVIRCFGIAEYTEKKASMNNFKKVSDLKSYVDQQAKPLEEKLLFDKCRDCSIYQRNGVSCGCYAYRIPR